MASRRAFTSGGDVLLVVEAFDQPVMLFRKRKVALLIFLGQRVRDRPQAAQAELEIVGGFERGFGPLPALRKDALALGGELLADAGA